MNLSKEAVNMEFRFELDKKYIKHILEVLI